jgi:hypothetical protein
MLTYNCYQKKFNRSLHRLRKQSKICQFPKLFSISEWQRFQTMVLSWNETCWRPSDRPGTSVTTHHTFEDPEYILYSLHKCPLLWVNQDFVTPFIHKIICCLAFRYGWSSQFYVSINFTKQRWSKSCFHYDRGSDCTFLLELVEGQLKDMENKDTALTLSFNKSKLANPSHLDFTQLQKHIQPCTTQLKLVYQMNRGISFLQKKGKVIHSGPTFEVLPNQQERILLQIKKKDLEWG